VGEEEPDVDVLAVGFLLKKDRRPPGAFFLVSLADCLCSVLSFGTIRQPEGTKSASATSDFDFTDASHDREPLVFMYTANGLLRAMK
jgi:hypothetical protein